jgi:hypothetical protein
MPENTQLTDVSDMAYVHEGFRRGLGDAREQLGFVADGDSARAAHFADYLAELLWFLHVHHGGEDELLYPLLVERVPEQLELLARMDAQHVAVADQLEAANAATAAFKASGSAADGVALADACESLWEVLGPHLAQEEAEVLPFAARYLTPEEWGKLPQHAFAHYGGERFWLPFGLATEAFPPAMREGMLAPPSPLGAMWSGGGSAAFHEEMELIRVETAWSER